MYEPSSHFGITVLTDTTERAPTFSLTPFENQNESDDQPSFCYLHLEGAVDSAQAWNQLLQREPRTLEWDGVVQLAGRKRLLGFDFSDRVSEYLFPIDDSGHSKFRISDNESELKFVLGDQLTHSISVTGLNPFARQMLLKLMMNIHSTLVMGRLDRYEDNLMTYVSAANNKLIDRAVRYVELLLRRRLPKHTEMPDYVTLCRELFRQKAKLPSGESIVLRTMAEFLPRGK